MRKKLMAMLLCVAMLLTLVPTMAFASDDPNYTLNATVYQAGSLNTTTSNKKVIFVAGSGASSYALTQSLDGMKGVQFATSDPANYFAVAEAASSLSGIAWYQTEYNNSYYIKKGTGSTNYLYIKTLTTPRGLAIDNSSTFAKWAVSDNKLENNNGYITCSSTGVFHYDTSKSKGATFAFYSGESSTSGSVGVYNKTATYDGTVQLPEVSALTSGFSVLYSVDSGETWYAADAAKALKDETTDAYVFPVDYSDTPYNVKVGLFYGDNTTDPIDSCTATVTINKAAVTVTADGATITKGGTKELTAKVDNKPAVGDKVDYELVVKDSEGKVLVSDGMTLKNLPVGEYDIVVVPGTNPNYEVTPTNAKLTVNPVNTAVVFDTNEQVKIIGGTTAGSYEFTEAAPGEPYMSSLYVNIYSKGDCANGAVEDFDAEAFQATVDAYNYGEGKHAALWADLELVVEGVTGEIKNAVLETEITVFVPYSRAVVGTKYDVLHWNGSNFDVLSQGDGALVGGVPGVTFKTKSFSPFVIVDTIKYWTVNFDSGEGYSFVYDTTADGAPDGESYTFELIVAEGYSDPVVVDAANGFAELDLAAEDYTTLDYEVTSDTQADGSTKYTVTLKEVKKAHDFHVDSITKWFSVSYDANGGVGAVPATTTYPQGKEDVAVDFTTLPTRAGYEFDGWLCSIDNVVKKADEEPAPTFTMPGEDVTFTAQWKAIAPTTYTVAYAKAGTETGTLPAGASYTEGTVFQLPGNTGALTYEGYHFVGWNDGTTTYVPGADYTMGTADVTFTAVWEADATTYTVAYNANYPTGVAAADRKGSAPTDTNSPYVTGTAVTVLDNTGLLTAKGYSFYAWNTKADGTGTTYAPGAQFNIAANTTLYAMWKADDQLTLTYKLEGGTYEQYRFGGWNAYNPSAFYDAGDEVTVANPDATVKGDESFLANLIGLFTNPTRLYKEGYTFAGWNTKKDGTGDQYAAGTKFNITGDMTLYAQWVDKYTVTYDLNGGTFQQCEWGTISYVWNDCALSTSYDVGTQVSVVGADFVNGGTETAGNANNEKTRLFKTGYVFTGWNTEADGSGVMYQPGNKFELTGNINLYAQWTKAYTVKFVLNDGGKSANDAIADQTLAEGSLVTVPTLKNTSYTDGGVTYYFNGWKNQKSDAQWWFEYDEVDSKTADASSVVTLVAQWDTEKLYTVIFDDNLVSPLDDYVTIDGKRTYDGDDFVGFVKFDDVASSEILHNVNKVPTFARVDYILGTDDTQACDWYLDAKYTYAFDPLRSLADNHVEEFVKDGVLTLYAKWTANYDAVEDVVMDADSLGAGYCNIYYSDFIEASHAINPYNSCDVYRNFHVVEKAEQSLPTGLYLNARTGELYGVPTAAGKYTFTVVMGSDEYVNTQGYTVWDPISAEQEFTVEIKPNELNLDHNDTSYNKVYGENDPADMLKNLTNLTKSLTVEQSKKYDGTLVDNLNGDLILTDTDDTLTINYTYATNNTDRTSHAATFAAVATKAALESNLKFAKDLSDPTVPATKQDVLNVSFTRMAGEDVGQYKYCLPVANVTGTAITAGAYTVVIPADFAATTMPTDHKIPSNSKYLFKITARDAGTVTAFPETYTYGNLAAGDTIGSTGLVISNLANNPGIKVVDTAAATVTDTNKSTAGYLKANTAGYTADVLSFAMTNGADPLGTASATTTKNYKAGTPTYSLAVAKLGITATATGKQVNVYTGATIGAAKMADFAELALTGVLASTTGVKDVVSIDSGYAVTYDLDLNNDDTYEETGLAAAAAATKLQTAAASAGTYKVLVHFTDLALTGDDAGNYNLTPATAETAAGEAKLVVTVRSSSTGSGFVPTTYKVTCGTGVTADKKNAMANATVTLMVAEGYDAPVVKDEDGKTVTVKASGSKYTFKMPASDVTVSVDAAVDTVCEDFVDINVADWSHAGIHYCLDNDLMNGFPDGTFAPASNTTRAQIVVMLWRMAGSPVVDYEHPFTDVKDSYWYTEAIRWAAAEEVVKGVSETEFAPDAPVTREQLAAMLHRYAQYKGQGFTGAWAFLLDFSDREAIGDWAYEAVCWCNMKGVVKGRTETEFVPGDKATRAEVATMFQRFCEDALDK